MYIDAKSARLMDVILSFMNFFSLAKSGSQNTKYKRDDLCKAYIHASRCLCGLVDPAQPFKDANASSLIEKLLSPAHVSLKYKHLD